MKNSDRTGLFHCSAFAGSLDTYFTTRPAVSYSNIFMFKEFPRCPTNVYAWKNERSLCRFNVKEHTRMLKHGVVSKLFICVEPNLNSGKNSCLKQIWRQWSQGQPAQDLRCSLAESRDTLRKHACFKCIENFTSQNWNFSDKKRWYFSNFSSKHKLWVLVRTASAEIINIMCTL